jgi:predicted transcriptional regulator
MDELVSVSTPTSTDFTQLAADLVSAYVSNNPVPMSEMPGLIASTHAALTELGKDRGAVTPGVQKLTPAQIRKSITHDALISFEDGKPYKTLRRHLTIRRISPEEYRAKWGLPLDYPMTAASYSETALAKSLGLGQQSQKAAQKATARDEAISEKPKRAGRPRKVKKAAEA